MEFKNSERTELSQLGEFGLIKRLSEGVSLKNPNSIFGIGDDCAVISADDRHYTLLSTDMLLEGIHFNLGYCPLRHLGYKAVVVNLSDVYAMNGKPEQVTVSVGVSNRFSVEAIDELYEGIKTACRLYEVDLVGGDTCSSQSGLVISVTVLGRTAKENICYRHGAQEKDLICVTGDLGAAYAGLQLLEREHGIFKENPNVQPDLEGFDYVIERQLKPEARGFLQQTLLKSGILPTAMIDISDGLASELFHISERSNCGVVIYEDKIPIDAATVSACDELGLSASTAALNGGEDYELLFTAPIKNADAVIQMDGVSVIGYITDKASGCNLIARGGQLVPLSAQGWNAFKAG
jgi:thiamine-monophosphate kinase